MEEWRDIKGYEGFYQVSNLGRVKSLERTFYSGENYQIEKTYPEKQITIQRYSTGYCYVVLCVDAVAKKFKVHRLVAMAFIPNPDGKPCIDHINTVRDDNRVENLRWVDNIQNQRNPLTCAARSRSIMGDNNPMKKRCRPVLQIVPDTGEVVAEYSGVKEAARQLGYDSGNISRCCNRKYDKCHGFIFRFKDNN